MPQSMIYLLAEKLTERMIVDLQIDDWAQKFPLIYF
jgi:hypothetical protein